MKKILFASLLLVVGCIVGCTNDEESQLDNETKTIDTNTSAKSAVVEVETGIQLVTINGCQYVVCKTGEGVAILHAANCTNPAHETQK